jgi:hypothetical protein
VFLSYNNITDTHFVKTQKIHLAMLFFKFFFVSSHQGKRQKKKWELAYMYIRSKLSRRGGRQAEKEM